MMAWLPVAARARGDGKYVWMEWHTDDSTEIDEIQRKVHDLKLEGEKEEGANGECEAGELRSALSGTADVVSK